MKKPKIIEKIIKEKKVEIEKGNQPYHLPEFWQKFLKQGDGIVLSYTDSLGDAHVKQSLFYDSTDLVQIRGVEDTWYLAFQRDSNNLGNKGKCTPVRPENVMIIWSIKGKEYDPRDYILPESLLINEDPEPAQVKNKKKEKQEKKDTKKLEKSKKQELKKEKKKSESSDSAGESALTEQDAKMSVPTLQEKKTVSGKKPHSQQKQSEKSERPTTPQTSDNSGIVEKDGRFFCPCGKDYSSKSHAKYHHRDHLKKKGN